jgi:general secretion pathway protein I
MTRASAQSGFTLIEALIAMALLAITAVSFLRATEANIQRVAALESRAAAAWVAQNRLAELTLGREPTEGPVPMLGRDFSVEVVSTPSVDTGLIQLDILASEVGGDASARLTGFVALLSRAQP